jgi:hypothetical protein
MKPLMQQTEDARQKPLNSGLSPTTTAIEALELAEKLGTVSEKLTGVKL